MSKQQLTYSTKMDKILELLDVHDVEFNVKLIKSNEQGIDSESSGLVKPNAIVSSGNFLDVALKLEDMINDFECLEIVYGPDNKVIWHMDDDKCDPKISDENFNKFVSYIENN